MCGPRPTPTSLRVLRGNPGHRALNTNEPKPEVAPLDPPSWLEGEAAEEWKRTAPKLQRLGLLSEVDVQALASYCQCWQRWREAEDKIKEFGMVVKGRAGYPIISPFVTVANRSMAQMKGYLIEFGMTPSARSRVTTPKDNDDDPFVEFDAGRLQRWTPEKT